MARLVRTLLVSLFLLLTISVPALASQLGGRVLDATQSIVIGARVAVIDRATGVERVVSTDNAGRFLLPDLRPGAYLLEVEMAGFRTEVINITLTNEPRDVEVVLDVGRLSDEVVVTTTTNPLLSSEVAHASTVIDGRAIEQAGRPLLGDVLRGLPGLRVQELGDVGSYATVRFRGMREADTAVLIDGHQIRDAGGLRGDVTSFLQQMLLVNLDRIEVVPGASSHLYGSSASGGVINLVPRLGVGQPTFDARFEAGALGLVRETVQSQGSIGKRVHYSAGAHRLDVHGGLDAHDLFRNTTLSGVARLDLNRDIQISAIAQMSSTPRADLNNSPFPIGPPGNELGFERGLGPVAGFVEDLDDADAYRASRLSTAIVSWQQRVNGAWNYSVSFQRTDSRRDFPDGPANHPTLVALGVPEIPVDVSLVEGRYHAIQTHHDVTVGQHQSITFGAESLREARTQQSVSLTTNTRIGPTTDRQGAGAVFAQHRFWLFDRTLNVMSSVRGQFFRVDNPESVPELEGLQTPAAYTGGVAVAYFARRSGTKIRGQVANGFREPSLSERFAVFNSSLGPLRIGNPLLRPERTRTLDGGVDQRVLSDRLQVSGTFFYNRLQEIITSRRRLFQQANEQGGWSKGVELAMRAMPLAGVELGAGYTYTRAEIIPTADVLRSDNTIASAGVSRSLESSPPHEWRIGGSIERGRWNVRADYTGTARYQEVLFSPRQFRPVLFEFDGYRRLDAMASFTLSRGVRGAIEPYVRAQNILGDDYLEDGFRTPGASYWAGIRYRFR